MFITKHILALVALAVGAASSCDVCSKELYDGKCGGLSQEAKGKWDDWQVVATLQGYGCIEDVCCAENKADCCEANVGAIVGLVFALVVVIGGCIFMCCRESIVACCREYFPDDTTYGVTVPPGPLGLQFQNGTCTVHAVTHRSPLRGVTKRGETLVSVNGKPVNAATMLDAIGAADDGTSERELVFCRSSKPSFAAGPAFRCVGVPPGPLGLQFQKGTCTVHAVKPTSPLLGATKEGETLVSVNGRPVNAADMLDEIKGADDGTSERMLVFRSSSKPLLAAGETENGPIVSKENAV